MLAGAPELINLTCPACRGGHAPSRLGLSESFVTDGGFVLEGILRCGNQACAGQFPIIQGVPVVIKDLRAWWRSLPTAPAGPACSSPQLHAYLTQLDDDVHLRQVHLSTYMTHHYQSADQSYWQTIAQALPDQGCGRALELGCSVGGFVFAAARRAEVAVGIDLDFALVAAAAGIQRSGEVRFRRCRRARGFEEVRQPFAVPDNVVFLVADALDPPLMAEDWDLVAALNLLDNVAAPIVLLGQMDALVRSGGRLVSASPYQWRPDITDPGEWLESESMDSPTMLRAILFDQLFPPMQFHYEPVMQVPDLTWTLVQQDRQQRSYQVDLIVAQKD